MATQLLIGTSGWTYDAWKTRFYPKNVPIKKHLEYYASQFPVVEINATFYRSFRKEVYINWYNKVPKKFKFILKVPRFITHFKYLKNVDAEIKRFAEQALWLEDKLGLLLLQLPPKMPYELERLHKALSAFPDPTKMVVEFRNPAWLTKETHSLLTEIGAIFCCVDSPTMQLSDWVTAKTAYIRLHGHKKWFNYNYSTTELNSIARHAQQMMRRGIKKLYILFNNDVHAYAPLNAKKLAEKFKIH